MYEAKILLDSVAPNGKRLVTMQAVFPRPFLAEFNTHRDKSRNSASSRAIPTEKLLLAVLEHPWVPEFNKRVTGMGVGDLFSPQEQKKIKARWLDARDYMVEVVNDFVEWGVDKSRANRLLEPFMWHTVIVTATEWSNFFALRISPDAQPEFAIIAEMMRDAMEASTPVRLEQADWHLPLLHPEDWDLIMERPGITEGLAIQVAKKVSVGRCARVSYLTHDGRRDIQADVDLHDRLWSNGHMSPFEHIATPAQMPWQISGNFLGWKQYRKEIPHEADYSRLASAA